MQTVGRVGGQCATGGEHALDRAQGGPVKIIAHALEQGRAGHPGKVRVLAADALQVFGERQLLTHKRAPSAQRPQHAEQQAVDMLGGDAADDAGLAQVGAPQGFQGLDLIGQLAQGFVDALRLAAGAGGAQAQLAGIQVKGGGGNCGLVERVKVARFGQPGVNISGPALAGLGLQVGGQQHADPGLPGAQQGDRQLAGVVQVHRQALDATGLQAGREAQGPLAQLRVIHRRFGSDQTQFYRLKQQMLKIDPIHTRPRTLCRISHSTANNSPIKP